MCDDNIFAVLIPCDRRGLALTAFNLKENAHFYRRGSTAIATGIAIEPTIGSREATPATQSSFSGNQDASDENYNDFDRILLTLDKNPKNPEKGWQFGTDPQSCDVLLGHRGTPRISGRHFRISIREDLRVFLYDESNYGTTVGFEGQNEDFMRRRDQWILSFEPGSPEYWDKVIVTVGRIDGFQFRIEFPNQRACRPEYLKKLRAFAEECKTELPFGALGLMSKTPSQPGTFCPRPHYIKRKLIGRGVFGEVHEVTSSRDGTTWARKTFHPLPRGDTKGKKRKVEGEEWLEKIKNEVAIMKEISHVSILPESQ